MRNNNGHRSRLRERFLKSGFDGFLDYEIIELLFTLSTPRKDCKQIARDLVKKYKNINDILYLESDELQQTNGIGPANSLGIRLYAEIKKRASQEKVIEKRNLNSDAEIAEYLKSKIGNKKKEYFVIICLDSLNNVIYDEVSVGTLNASLVHPREVFSKAVLCHANQIIVAHNHPSGDPTPSQPDIETYRRLKDAGRLLGISLLNGYVVAGEECLVV